MVLQHFLQKHSLSLSAVFPFSLPFVWEAMLSAGPLHWSCSADASSETWRKSSNDDPKAPIFLRIQCVQWETYRGNLLVTGSCKELICCFRHE